VATTFGVTKLIWKKAMCYRRLVVQLVLLFIAVEAPFAKSGLLHLFSSEARFPSVSESASSPSLRAAVESVTANLLRKSVEVRPISPGEFASARGRT
jgi:hypothetical protein